MKKKIEIIAPDLPESVNNAVLLKWHKKKGEYLQEDELIAEIETDKIILEISSPKNGILISQNVSIGQNIKSKSILGYIEKINNINNREINTIRSHGRENDKKFFFTPTMRRLISCHKIDTFKIQGIKISEKVTKNHFIINNQQKTQANKLINNPNEETSILGVTRKNNVLNERSSKTIEMNPLRKKISERLLSTRKNTAMLTTFNEVNMSLIIKIRKKYQNIFQEKHTTKLGYMSFFVKATTQALKQFPEINASIEGTNIVYHNYYDINIAVSSPRGLITPILKNTDCLSMSEIEKKINSFSTLERSKQLKLEDLDSGTFTITNGGVFGSLMSTPIINPPQVAILGMHNIKQRPVVVKDKIKIQPMMYLALSYDHQLIDGKQAIQFLNYIINIIEDFSRMIIDV
ncbi:dihydrolipoyllysine-residue succinyltransferase [Buchnera aphidicola]|uniref:dihydrolipoyllysine-residue succinyltransferase n=1 Tax=Buchnera aphidicola TaxID=9 RepID=UPI00094C6D4D|nr:dihydrolipoyllysine-residue succinyltransferase [Buchnera aphidicola]